MKWKRTKKGGKGERKDGEEGEEGKQELEEDMEGEEEEEDNIQVDSPPPDMDDLNNSNNLQSPSSSSSPPHFEIKSETPDQHHLPPPALNPFYLPGKINNFTSFPSHSTFSTASFPTNAFANQHLGLKPRDLREAFNLARRPEAEAEVAESR